MLSFIEFQKSNTILGAIHAVSSDLTVSSVPLNIQLWIQLCDLE